MGTEIAPSGRRINFSSPAYFEAMYGHRWLAYMDQLVELQRGSHDLRHRLVSTTV